MRTVPVLLEERASEDLLDAVRGVEQVVKEEDDGTVGWELVTQ